jgi:hypothetical protein
MAFGSLDGSDYDPYGVPQEGPDPEASNRAWKILSGIAGGLKQQVATPGAVMQPNPYPAGSEEAAWYDANRQETMANWAPGMAMNTMGTGAFARPAVIPGETVLGAGAVRPKVVEPPAAVAPAPAVDVASHPAHNPTLEQAFRDEMGADKGDAAYQAYIASHGEPPNVARQTPDGIVGGGGGDPGLSEAQASAKRWAGGAEPLESPRILTRFTPPKPGELPASARPETFPVKEAANERSMREQTGYGTIARADAAKVLEAAQGKGQPLAWSDAKMRAVSAPDYVAISHPRVSVDRGRISVEDGGHRIAAAAKNGQKIDIAVKTPEEAAHLEGLGAPPAPAVLGNRSKFVDPDTGLAIKGPAYTKEAQAISRDIAAGPKGEGPMDLSLQKQTPDVLQQPLERYVPPRGVSPRMRDALENPAVHEGLAESMRAGAGVQDWYHTEPVRQEFLKTMGPEEGENAFKRFMDIVAATSPRSDVPTNVRNASYYYAGGDPAKANPYPYGHVAQNLHKQNVTNLNERGGWDVMQNPKPASFAENLRGNLEPVTVDTHAFRNIGMRTGDPRFLETSISQLLPSETPSPTSLAGRFGEIRKNAKGETVVTYRPQQLVKDGKLTMEEAQKIPSFWSAQPKESEYGAAEQLFRQVGAKVGMRPADAQAAAWAGGGDLTGLGTVDTHTFPELMNERITFTAKMRGEDPKKVLQDFITGKKPLLSIGAAAGAGATFGSLDGSPAEAGDLSGFRRSGNIEDRRMHSRYTPQEPSGPELTADDIENGRFGVPVSVMDRALGGGDLDRAAGYSLLRRAFEDRALLDEFRNSMPEAALPKRIKRGR